MLGAVDGVGDPDRADQCEHRRFVSGESGDCCRDIFAVGGPECGDAEIAFEATSAAVGADAIVAGDGDIDLADVSGTF